MNSLGRTEKAKVDLAMAIDGWDESANYMDKQVLPSLAKNGQKLAKNLEALQELRLWTGELDPKQTHGGGSNARATFAHYYEAAQAVPVKDENNRVPSDAPPFALEYARALRDANERDSFAASELLERQESDTLQVLRELQSNIKACQQVLKKRKDAQKAAARAQSGLKKETERLEQAQQAAEQAGTPPPSTDKRNMAEAELHDALNALIRADAEAERVCAPLRLIHEKPVDSVVGDALRLAFDHQRIAVSQLLSTATTLARLKHPDTLSPRGAAPAAGATAATAQQPAAAASAAAESKPAVGPSGASSAAAPAVEAASTGGDASATASATTGASAATGAASAGTKPPLFEGNLYKKGDKRRNWKKRWFVLQDGIMSYHAKESKDSKEIGHFEVRGMKLQFVEGLDKHQFVLQIQTPGRAWYLEASSDSSLNRWKDACVAHGGLFEDSPTLTVTPKVDGEASSDEEDRAADAGNGSDDDTDDSDGDDKPPARPPPAAIKKQLSSSFLGVSLSKESSAAFVGASLKFLGGHVKEDGLFRQSGDEGVVVALLDKVAAASAGAMEELISAETDPHVVANALKRHLRTREAGPLFSAALVEKLRQALSVSPEKDSALLEGDALKSEAVAEQVADAFEALADDPLAEHVAALFSLLNEIAEEADNPMDADALQTCMAQSLLGLSASGEADMIGLLIRTQKDLMPL